MAVTADRTARRLASFVSRSMAGFARYVGRALARGELFVFVRSFLAWTESPPANSRDNAIASAGVMNVQPPHVTFVERRAFKSPTQGARKGGREEGPSEHLPRPTDSVLTDSGEVGETKHAQCTECGQLGQERPNRKRARQNSKLTEAETRKKGNKDKTPSDKGILGSK